MTQIKVGLVYKTTHNPWGGVNTFFRNFEEHLKDCDVLTIASSLREADVILSTGHYKGPGRLLKQRNFRNLSCGRDLESWRGILPYAGNKKIVFRVDGLRSIYANTRSNADDLLIHNMKFADSIVFQSSFSRHCFDSLNIPYPSLFSTINNGTLRSIFYPNKHPKSLCGQLRLVSNSWSTNLQKGFRVIADFSDMPNVEVVHIGRWPTNVPIKRVKLLGEMKAGGIANVLRDNHFLLFPSKNEACSNTVVEALACGLPVLYHSSGGTQELCQGTRFGLPLPNDLSSVSSIELFIEMIRNKFAELQEDVLSHIDNFYFETCLQQYANFFQTVLAK